MYHVEIQVCVFFRHAQSICPHFLCRNLNSSIPLSHVHRNHDESWVLYTGTLIKHDQDNAEYWIMSDFLHLTVDAASWPGFDLLIETPSSLARVAHRTILRKHMPSSAEDSLLRNLSSLLLTVRICCGSPNRRESHLFHFI